MIQNNRFLFTKIEIFYSFNILAKYVYALISFMNGEKKIMTLDIEI